MNFRSFSILAPFLVMVLSLVIMARTQTQLAPEATEVWEPVPETVQPGDDGQPPSDAIVLFDGRGLAGWRGKDGEPRWDASDEAITVTPGAGDLYTKRSFGDVQLHIEWRSPVEVVGEGQGRGNSGVFLMSRYEVQVLDSFENRTYSNGQAGSIYKQYIPLVNASRPPGQWQSYDIIFCAPRFRSDATLERPATMTVLHNGVLVQNHVTLRGPTLYIGEPVYEAHPAKAPLMLQDHGNPVSFRNIWVRELERTPSTNQ